MKSKKTPSPSTIFASLGLLAIPAHAEVVLDGQTWNVSSNASNLTLTDGGTVMNWATTGNSEVRAYFAAPGEQLSIDAVGTFIEINFQVRFTGATDNNDGMRWGLLNSLSTTTTDNQVKGDGGDIRFDSFIPYRGYGIFFNPTTTHTSHRERTGSENRAMLAAAAWTDAVTEQSQTTLGDGTWFDVSIRAERIEGGVEFSYLFSDPAAPNTTRIVRTDTLDFVTSFDSIFLAKTGNTAMTSLEMRNFSVIPDPKSGELAITDFTVAPDENEVSITFNSVAGKLYDIEQSLTLGSFESIAQIVATGPITTFTRSGVALEPREFFRVEDLGEAPPLFSEDFETNDGGFTTEDKSAGGLGSDWAHGAPTSVGVGTNQVTSGNDGSDNAFGTDISNPGFVTAGTITCLRSPVIDLTGVASASLRFAEALDIEEADLAEVWIIEAGTDTPIVATPIHTSEDTDINFANWTGVGPIAIPAAALDQQVRFEWRFTKVGSASDYLGWFIDDVEITQP